MRGARSHKLTFTETFWHLEGQEAFMHKGFFPGS